MRRPRSASIHVCSGRLEASELAAAFKKGGFVFPDHVLRRMIRVTDKTGKNSLSFEEFLQLTAFLEEMRTNFRRADQDGNGKVPEHHNLSDTNAMFRWTR